MAKATKSKTTQKNRRMGSGNLTGDSHASDDTGTDTDSEQSFRLNHEKPSHDTLVRIGQVASSQQRVFSYLKLLAMPVQQADAEPHDKTKYKNHARGNGRSKLPFDLQQITGYKHIAHHADQQEKHGKRDNA